MEIDMTKPVKVQVKTLKINLKCRDEFACVLLDSDNEILIEYEGYVPSFMPGQHFGDYLKLDIDIDTGIITNWPKLNKEELQSFLEKGYT